MEFFDSTEMGMYGSFAIKYECYGLWKCYESSDYTYWGVVDDYGNIVPVTTRVNLRGY